ncbi:glycosyltransferase, partial [Micrococcus sp. SIMBA_144]
KNDFEVILVIGSDNKNEYVYLVNNDIEIIYLHEERQRGIVYKLSSLIRNERPDLLFSTLNLNNIILLLSKALSFQRIPTVVREANNRTQSGQVSNINKIITHILYNFFANSIISLSKGVEDDLKKNFKIISKKIKIIYNPIDIAT